MVGGGDVAERHHEQVDDGKPVPASPKRFANEPLESVAVDGRAVFAGDRQPEAGLPGRAGRDDGAQKSEPNASTVRPDMREVATRPKACGGRKAGRGITSGRRSA